MVFSSGAIEDLRLRWRGIAYREVSSRELISLFRGGSVENFPSVSESTDQSDPSGDMSSDNRSKLFDPAGFKSLGFLAKDIHDHDKRNVGSV